MGLTYHASVTTQLGIWNRDFFFLQYDAYGDDPFWPPENITIGYMIARPKKVDHRKYPDNPLRVLFIGKFYVWRI